MKKLPIADGSTLEALFKKLKSLEDVPQGQLAGKIGVVIDLMTRLPVEIWFKENPKTNDTKFEEDLLELVNPSTLLLLDRGFYQGIVKQVRKNNTKLIVAPFPEKQRNTPEFFFSTKSLTYA